MDPAEAPAHRLSSDQDSEIRCEEFLRIKIGEAKNLNARNGTVRDVYCTVNLDREEIFRTTVAEKTQCPFFAEEFHFEVPRRFRKLAVYLCEKENRTAPGKAVGKVAIRREDLNQYHGKDYWIPITAVDEDSEVEGKVHLSIKMDHVISSKTGSTTEKLAVRIIECSDLPVVSGSCDPFAIVTLTDGKDRMDSKRTKTKRKTASPLFDETFHFNLEQQNLHRSRNTLCTTPDPIGISGCEVRVSIQHETGVGFGSTFLGEIRIPLHEIDMEKGYKCWHMLQPRPANDPLQQKPALGSLRLKIQFTSDYVLSSRYYEPLKFALLDSTECQPISSSPAFILGAMTGNKVDAVQPLVKLFVKSNKVLPLVRSLAEWEIPRVTDANTIFRGNTLLSKFLDELMKLIGSQYLHETLRYVVHRVIRDRKDCEIDPSRVKEGHSLEENTSNLTTYLDLVFKSIITSVMMCPQLMRDSFSILKELSLKYFQEREICYSVIAGFIFLRFFAPAILNPKLFELTDQTIDASVARTLTLMSKTIVVLGNMVSCRITGYPAHGPIVFKEDYMTTLQKAFITNQHVENTRVFLELISSPSSVPRINDRPITLKEGILLKRVSGQSNKYGVSFNKFKRRHFCLTTHNLFYAKAKDKPVSWNLPVADITGVEKLREDSFKMKHMFQILFHGKALYIKANNCVDAKEWMDILNRVCVSNQNRLRDYHPSAYIGNHWLCCHQTMETATGCCPVSKSLPSDIAVHIDSDREVARIHSLLMNQMEMIDDLILRTSKNHADTQFKSSPSILIEDRSTVHSTLCNLKAIIANLDSDQKMFLKKEWNDTIYGSEKAPIGDTAYLSLFAQHLPLNESKTGDQIKENGAS